MLLRAKTTSIDANDVWFVRFNFYVFDKTNYAAFSR
jgi:hypothetical protein